MRLYDTHCHFESSDPREIATILARAKAAGVEKLMAVGGSRELNLSAQLAAGQRAEDEGRKTKDEGQRAEDDGRRAEGEGRRLEDEGRKTKDEGRRSEALPEVVCALGYDRDQVGKVDTSALHLTPTPSSLRAIGEIGLDYHYAPEMRAEQLKLFGEQLELAREKDLPVVIHTREADEDTVALLKEIPSRGIIHCYTGTPEYAKRFLDLGFYISFSGIVTFRAADNVRASVRVVPDDRILIETDSPFLAPVPMRGQANEPAFIRHTCEFLGTFREMSAEDFAELTFANAERILG